MSFDEFLQRAVINLSLSKKEKYRLSVDGSEIKSGWLRKDTEDSYHFNFLLNNSMDVDHTAVLQNYLRKETRVSKQLFLSSRIEWLCDYTFVNKNKIEVLEVAHSCGLNIPGTLVTNRKQELSEFLKNNNIDSFIVKSIGENLNLVIDNEISYYQPVKLLNKNDVPGIPDKFLPTIFQEAIQKKYDLRLFYIHEKLYCMAIMSDDIDFRLSYERNRYLPFNVPDSTRKSVIKFMHKLGLNIGSLDLIMDMNDEVYFLEVNPTGEYDFMEKHCNYNIPKIIANQLCYGHTSDK